MDKQNEKISKKMDESKIKANISEVKEKNGYCN
jgi:hypothetical protein